LLVEDHDDSREMLTESLQHLGAQVVAANSAAQAMRFMRAVRPDVLVSDLSMPDEDGFELLRQVRASPYLRDVPAIAVTGHTGMQEKAAQCGFQRFLRKPLDPGELCRMIAAVATRRPES
jgi:CheY-like chemotaxis protein